MLVVNDRRLLGDGTLDFEEAMRRYTEGTLKMMRDYYTLEDHDNLVNRSKRMGMKKHSSELIQEIVEMNPTCWVEQQVNAAIYANEDEWGLYTDVNGKKLFLTSFGKGWMPEYSYIVLGRDGLPWTRCRGWRESLFLLLSLGCISWEQVESRYGDATGCNSYRWRRMTKMYRTGDASRRIERKLTS